jgi:hypothetical protein
VGPDFIAAKAGCSCVDVILPVTQSLVSTVEANIRGAENVVRVHQKAFYAPTFHLRSLAIVRRIVAQDALVLSFSEECSQSFDCLRVRIVGILARRVNECCRQFPSSGANDAGYCSQKLL